LKRTVCVIVGPVLRTAGFCVFICCRSLYESLILFALLHAKQQCSLEHTETSLVCVNESNMWAMSTEHSWSDSVENRSIRRKVAENRSIRRRVYFIVMLSNIWTGL